MKRKLSVTIITLNEEQDLRRCLDSLEGLADEVVVVDSGSTDKTVEIAKKYKAKVFHNKFVNYADQKNYALSKTTSEWVLSVDADEVVSSDLSEEISLLLQKKDIKFSAFTIPRRNVIFKKEIKYTRWQPELDRHVWLWKKNLGKWVGDVHEEVSVEGSVGKLSAVKIHYQYETIREFLVMVNKYTELEAREGIAKGRRFSYFQFVFQPVYNFSVRYFYRLGYLD